MNKGVFYILWFWVWLCGLGCIYFIFLAAGLPFWSLLATQFAWVAAIYVAQRRATITIDEEQGMGRLTMAIVAICLGFFISNAVDSANKHGGWDAFCIWNFHARHLADPAHWRNMFLNIDSEHPDYPPLQPSVLAFFFRLSGGTHREIIAFAFAAMTTVSVVTLLLSRLWSKNKIVALITLYIFCRNPFFVASGVSEYADMLVAFLLLAAFICIEETGGNPIFAGLVSFFLLSAAATKTEGAVLAILLILGYARRLFSRGALPYFLGGLVIPLVTLVVFKNVCGLTNDMVSSLSPDTLRRLVQWQRYPIIYSYLNEVMDQKFGYVQIGLLLTFLVSLFRKALPGHGSVVAFSCFLAYFFVYVVTPHELEWHMHTSMDRLLLQLTPLTCYLIAIRLSSTGINVASFNGRKMF